MAGSQKNRPVDPDVEDSITFEDGTPVSVAYDNVGDLHYTMQVDGVPVISMNDEQIYRCIEELARFMDKPLKLHDPKPESISFDSANPDYALLLNHGDSNSRTVLHEMLDHVVRGAMTRADVGDISIARIR